MPGEGRGLSSRQTQDVVRDLEIGQPSNSEKGSETADGVTRESEGGSWLSLLRSVRQDQPRGYPGACLCPVPLEQGRTGSRRSGLCGHRKADLPPEIYAYRAGRNAQQAAVEVEELLFRGHPEVV